MSLPGKLLYLLWHKPVGKVHDILVAGGPWQMRRTERGRIEMETAARSMPAVPGAPMEPVQVHLLTGARFWYQTQFCLWTLAKHSNRPLAPVIYDDGTLLPFQRHAIEGLFPNQRLIARTDSISQLERHLPSSRFPALRERWRNYPNIRKLIDPHIGSSGWKLVLDSDLLFFRQPRFLLDWLENPNRPLHAVDCETSYGYSRALMEELAGKPIADLVNVGLIGLKSESIDWEKIEFWTNTLIKRERTSYYLEQALVAMLLAGQPCAIAPASEYVTKPISPEALRCSAVMHHYVANSKRWYFQLNWRTALAR